MKRALHELGALDRYTAAAERAAAQIIGAYSTSFAASTQLLGRRHRTHVRNIYALVRVADELVDGATAEAGVTLTERHRELDLLEEETARALRTGYSSNAIVHAFARTARTAGIGDDLTAPFFASMRADLPAESEGARATPIFFDRDAHAAYVFGSAEVVGLMCLRVFIRDETLSHSERQALEHGARSLGAAFQNINFLRDLADDTDRLGRSYLTGQGRLGPVEKARWIATIRAQLADASATLPLLPRDARTAVTCALRLFSVLADRLETASAAELYTRRIRVSGVRKSWLLMRALLESQLRSAR